MADNDAKIEHAACAAVNAYRDSVRGMAYDGREIPAWGGLTEAIRDAWREAARAARAV